MVLAQLEMSSSRETVSGTNRFAGGFENVTFAI
jgi:hypothetical protein